MSTTTPHSTPPDDRRAHALARTGTISARASGWSTTHHQSAFGATRVESRRGPREEHVVMPPSPAGSVDSMMLGDVVGGRYRLDAFIGRGGFGRVWRATDLLSEEPVAVKVCAVRDGARETLVRDEVTALRWAALPGVVRLRDDGFDETRAWLVMDLVDGRPFPGRSRAPLGELAAQLLEIIARLHGIGIVHGDLKPGNVLVDAAGRPTVLDLGIARGRALRVGNAPVTHLTRSYAAPEQIWEQRVEARSDLYSIGLMIERGAKALGIELDEALHALVDALTQERPEHRPASAVVALAMLGDAARVDGLPSLSPAACATDLEALFSGPEPFLHRRSAAAAELWRRTAGRVDAMRRELRSWLVAGFAWRDGDRIAMRPEGLARLVDGDPVVVHHPLPPLSEAATDLLCWVRLALPSATLDRLRRTVPLSSECFAEAHAELIAREAIWALPDGTIGTWVMDDPAPHWSLARLQDAHTRLADSLPSTSPEAVRHAISADYTADGLADRIASVSRLLIDEGRLREARALLEQGLDLARETGRADAEALLLSVYTAHALADERVDALRHARYLVGRAMYRTPKIVTLDTLLAAAQAGTSERASDLLTRIGPFDDDALAHMWQRIAVTNARRAGPDAEAAAVDALGVWATADRPSRWPDYLCRKGKLRYRQARYLEAAHLHADAARTAVSRLVAMDARVSEAAALLEAFEVRHALARAVDVREEARALRHAWYELNAVFVERAARYRLGSARHPQAELVRAAAHLGPKAEAMIASIEAAIAWRFGEPAMGRQLALRAAQRFTETGPPDGATLFRALAFRCGADLTPDEVEALISAASGALPDFGVQALGLLAFALPAGQLVGVVERLLDRGRPPAHWGHRLDVLSYHEALELTGVEADAITRES